jgi:UDP-N-acetylmuramate: L-alanyl-gamma-D-glutamyl-meso-diaminopimelate ligase
MKKKVYFMGIAGTGMASTAGLALQAGWQVSGSDANVYPPMSDMLNELNISVATPYDAKNLKVASPDLVIVANVLSKNHVEVQELLAEGIPYTSYPEFLGTHFLSKRHSVVVSGTHGKTTTSSLLTHILRELGEAPGYMIGGIPKAFKKSFDLGNKPAFVIEGDEYDTAFFDKESKFLHYHPKHLILNNIEFDHADIFNSIEDIYKMFEKLLVKVSHPSQIIANIDDPGVIEVLKRTGLTHQVTSVSAWGKNVAAPYRVLQTRVVEARGESQIWEVALTTKRWGDVTCKTTLSGDYNAANLCQIIACLDSMMNCKVIATQDFEAIEKAVFSFQNVKRRLDHLGTINDVIVMEDFAHHPTAVKLLIESLKRNFPNRRLIAAFEPRNATSRRKIFERQYADVLSKADIALIGACPEDLRIPLDERMNTKNIAAAIGSSAHSFSKNEDLQAWLLSHLQPADLLVFMSSGSFSGIQHQTMDALFQKFGKESSKGVELSTDSI